MLNKLLLSLLIASQLQAATKLSSTNIYAPARLGTVEVQHSSTGFMVNNQQVEPQNMDKELRSITAPKLAAALRSGYVQVDRSCNGHYKLQYQPRLNGGGFWGATIGYFAGKGAVYLAGYGTISLISVCTGPFAKGTFVALSKMSAPFIEVASNKVGLAAGISLGAATGPV